MAREVRSFAVTIPAGTPAAAPITQNILMPERVVAQVSWRVPPGPSGLMGWRLTMGGVQVIPLPDGAWIVADNAAEQWAVDGQPTTGSWEVQAYNTGANPHTVYLDFLLDLVGQAAPSAALTAAGTQDVTGLTGTVSAASQ